MTLHSCFFFLVIHIPRNLLYSRYIMLSVVYNFKMKPKK